MGYRKQKKIFVLTFEEPGLEGLEVRATSTSLDKMMGMLSLVRMSNNAENLTESDVEELQQLFRVFSSCLRSWNLEEEDGTPVSFEPIEIDGVRETPVEAKHRVLMSQDLDFVMALAMAWMDGMVGTPGPLDGNSSGGERSEVPPMPMETLSANPLN